MGRVGRSEVFEGGRLCVPSGEIVDALINLFARVLGVYLEVVSM